MQFKVEKNNEIHRLKKNNPFRFRFRLLIFQQQLIRSVNDLKINGFCRLLTDTSVNFRKPPFRYWNFAQPSQYLSKIA